MDEHSAQERLALAIHWATQARAQMAIADEEIPHELQTAIRLLSDVLRDEYGEEVCEGCPNIAKYNDSEGVPLCQECWDACAAEEAAE